MYRQIMGPDQKDGYVDGKNPEHKDKHRVRVVVEIVVGAGSLFTIRLLAIRRVLQGAYSFPNQPQRPGAC